MKKSELKAIIKETIKECITEVLLENRVFSNLIGEVMRNTQKMVLENSSHMPSQPVAKQPSADHSRYREISENLSLRNRSEFHKETPTSVRQNPRYGEPAPDAPVYDVMSSGKDFSDLNEISAFSKIEEQAEAVNVIPVQTLDILFISKKLI